MPIIRSFGRKPVIYCQTMSNELATVDATWLTRLPEISR